MGIPKSQSKHTKKNNTKWLNWLKRWGNLACSSAKEGGSKESSTRMVNAHNLITFFDKDWMEL